ncbi:SDR family oxidoreductase [Nocardia yamanashiensis]|uniref:SDR family NAD(P)-dependent oxidoreductase n=1 Tax=Nocardia yamanashiensis TaxID=209247 RepID=UPI001E5BD5ED|nr:SDR family oxidoreductase [Nocardia yamanashiensis]UGT42569.1 SDR family oxidoreductase [Nocardia yamanashiensis]
MTLTADAGSWSVVTGASSGIGSALAEQLADRGHDLVLVARRTDRLREIADRLTGKYGVTVEVVGCDLSDRAARAEFVENLRTRTISVLCNNAGFPVCGTVADADSAAQIREVEVNVVAMHELTQAVLPGMLARRRGAILITGSNAGEQPVPTAAVYAASKAFTNSFAEALHQELRGTGVTCTVLAPGPVLTEFSRVGGVAAIERHRIFVWLSAERVAREALEGLSRGHRMVIPGLMAKTQAYTGRYIPRSLLFPILRIFILPRLRSALRQQLPESECARTASASAAGGQRD